MSLKMITAMPVVAMLAAIPVSKASAQGANLSNVRIIDFGAEDLPYKTWFKIDQGIGSCPYGTWFYYDGHISGLQGEDLKRNVEANHATVIGARWSNFYVKIYNIIYQSSYICSVDMIHGG